MKKTIVFLALTFGLSTIFYIPIIASGHLGGSALGLMWSPGLAAMLTEFYFERTLRGLGWQLGKLKFLLTGLLLPIGYGLAIYLYAWNFGVGDFNPGAGVATLVIGSLLNFPIAILLALGEEIGWRGFLAPHLSGLTNFTKTALISGLIWAVWHIPVILFADYNAGTPLWFAVSCFLVSIISVGLVMAWLRLASGSVWGAVLMHASHNTVIQGVFDRLTVDTGYTRYFTTEFGLGLAFTTLVLAFYFWRRRGLLPAPAQK